MISPTRALRRVERWLDENSDRARSDVLYPFGAHAFTIADLREVVRLAREGAKQLRAEPKPWDPKRDQYERCAKCRHTYERHFDSHEDMAPVGCKYCGCRGFVSPKRAAVKRGQKGKRA